MVWFVPESHIYYARKSQHEKAKASMSKLYGNVPEYDVVRRTVLFFGKQRTNYLARNTNIVSFNMVSKQKDN